MAAVQTLPAVWLDPEDPRDALCLGDCVPCHKYALAHPEYLDFCEVPPARVGAFLASPRLCALGPPLVPLSLDLHVFGLGAFSGGEQQVLDAPLQGAARAVVDFVQSACAHLQARSVGLFAQALERFAIILGPARAADSPPPHRGPEASHRAASVKYFNATAEPSLGELHSIGGTLAEIYRFHDRALRHRRVRLPNAPCGEATTEYDLAVQEALEVGRAARLFMDHIRVAIAMKMLHAEVHAAVHLAPHMWPQIAFQPAFYGRHWDVLRGLVAFLAEEEREGMLLVEIGVACGQNGPFLLRHFPQLRYVGIDPTILDSVAALYEPLGDRAELWQGTSQEMIDRLPESSIDLLFIDGPHTYAQVRHDITHFASKVRPGGILAGHDFTPTHPPLLWAVCEQFLGATLNLGADGVWWSTV